MKQNRNWKQAAPIIAEALKLYYNDDSDKYEERYETLKNDLAGSESDSYDSQLRDDFQINCLYEDDILNTMEEICDIINCTYNSDLATDLLYQHFAPLEADSLYAPESETIFPLIEGSLTLSEAVAQALKNTNVVAK